MILSVLLLAAAAAPAPMPAPTSADLLELQRFSACVVNRVPRLAAQAVDHDFREQPQHWRQLDRLASSQGQCVGFAGSRLRIRGVVLAGFLSEALLKAKGVPAIAPGGVQVAARDESETIGLCLALAKPAEARALFGTAPGSEAEKVAMVPMLNELGACTSAGMQARFNRPGLRAVIALAYRRLTMRDATNA